MRTTGPLLRAFFRPVFLAVTIAFAARLLVVQVFAIPSSSMSPTLQPGDQVLVTPYDFPWGQRAPVRGDVVVFRRTDGTPGYFVKRVVGLPGDHLEIRDGTVFVDGSPLEEPYVRDPGGEMQADIVPAGSYFVLGDHRDDSIDSRVWGFVPGESIVGHARLVFWSSGGDSTYENASASAANGHGAADAERVRWDRVFTIVR